MDNYAAGIPASIEDILASLEFFLPETILIIGFIAVILGDLFSAGRRAVLSFAVALITILLSLALIIPDLNSATKLLFDGMIVRDSAAAVFKILFAVATLFFLIFSRYNSAIRQHPKGSGDLFSVTIALLLGLNLMAMSQNLLMVYLSLEMVSLGSYILTGYVAGNARQSEAAMKYALFGAFCSAIMLYGMSLVYTFTGTLDINDPGFVQGLSNTSSLAVGLAALLVFVGIAFKISLVPFHFWAPDVYEGAPTPVTALLSTAPKIAGFALLWRFVNVPNLLEPAQINDLLAVLAIASMVIGNFAAIWQKDVKRMLAYSAIGHTGFITMALFVLPGTQLSPKALFFYLAVYLLMNFGAFLIADEVEDRTGTTQISGYRGIGQTSGVLMTMMVIIVVSLTGLPPTAGFTAKVFVFSNAIDVWQSTGSHLVFAAVLTGAVTTVVALFYYLKIPLYAFLRAPEWDLPATRLTVKGWIASVIAVVLVLLVLFPSLIESWL